jgi:peptide subunit release factor 1 (eRF1)
MSAKKMHGHAVKNETLELPKESKEVLRCVKCGMSVDKGHPDVLEDYDCEHYQEVRAGIEGDSRSAENDSEPAKNVDGGGE